MGVVYGGEMNIRLKSRGLTLIELLVVVGLIGLVVALALPATISAREAVRRAHCANNLKQIGLAFRLYADAHGMFAGGTECPWTIGVLPYLEQKDAASRYQTGRPSSSPENQTIATTMISAFLCPSERNVVLSNGWVVSNYAANAAILARRTEEVTDGLSNTALATDIPSSWFLPWIEGPSCSPGFLGLIRHGDLRPILFADGHVVSLSTHSPVRIWDTISTPDGGEIAESPSR